MLSLSIRVALFFGILILGLGFGWEFLISAIIFFASIGKNYWEFLLLGLLFDLSLSFPPLFFTILIIVILASSLFGRIFFKSEGSFNHITNAFLLSILSLAIIFLYLASSFGGDWFLVLKLSIFSFLKIFLPLLAFILLVRMVELKRGSRTQI